MMPSPFYIYYSMLLNALRWNVCARNIITVTLLVVSLSGCSEDSPHGITTTGTNDHGVALYADRGADDDCIQASKNMFEWMGCNVTLVDANRIINEGLDGFSLICVPGGDMYQYAYYLSSKGRAHIKQFIEEGGGYIGICGGSYFAASRVVWRGDQLPMIPLALFDGAAEGPINSIHPYPQYGMCQIDFTNTSHPIAESLPDSAWVLYYWGPHFMLDKIIGIDILGMYSGEGKACMLAFEYGNGRVFLIGAHPEFEEDSDRDSVSFADQFNDRGSDWDLMKRAFEWCVEN